MTATEEVKLWQFFGEPPSADQVADLLLGLPTVWGVDTAEFIEFVQPLPSRVRVKRPHPTNPAVKVDEYLDTFTLYMSVAGRVKMLERAQAEHSWSVYVEPEPVTPTGMPGYLAWEPRLVHRVYVKIVGEEGDVGVRYGTAWVPFSGGSQAAGSNPFEKVETSALGRALGAWGFGVLPGSGIASLEEMQGLVQNRAGMEAEADPSAQEAAQTEGDLLMTTLTLLEESRQLRGESDEETKARAGKYVKERFGLEVYDPGKNELDWQRLRRGQLILMNNAMRETIRQLKAAGRDL